MAIIRNIGVYALADRTWGLFSKFKGSGVQFSPQVICHKKHQTNFSLHAASVQPEEMGTWWTK